MKHKHIYPVVTLTIALLMGGQSFGQTGVTIKPKVYLQAALHGLLPTATLMRDDLRKQGFVPMTEPYSAYSNFQHAGSGGGETITGPSVLEVTGGNAIVDWVVLELRHESIIDQPLATRSALLQRDGDVVDVDGVSPVTFPQIGPGSYYVVINHRSHLGAMSKNPLQLSATPTEIDFSNPGFPINCENTGMVTLGAKRALWGGDLNNDGRRVYQGPGNDILKLFTTVLYDSKNTESVSNFISTGYFDADANMDGKVIFSGMNNDRSVVLQFHLLQGIPQNSGVVGLECIP